MSRELSGCKCSGCSVRERREAGEPLAGLVETLRRGGDGPRNAFGRLKRFYAGAEFPAWKILGELGDVRGNRLFLAQCKGCGVVKRAFHSSISAAKNGCRDCAARAMRADPSEMCAWCGRRRAQTNPASPWARGPAGQPECNTCARRAHRNGRAEDGTPHRGGRNGEGKPRTLKPLPKPGAPQSESQKCCGWCGRVVWGRRRNCSRACTVRVADVRRRERNRANRAVAS